MKSGSYLHSKKNLKVALMAGLGFLVNHYDGGHWHTCKASKALPTRLGPMLSAGCEAGVAERLSLAGGEAKHEMLNCGLSTVLYWMESVTRCWSLYRFNETA